jgi:hypothetical protein
VEPTVDNLRASIYTPAKTLCLVLPRQPSEAALRVVAFARSTAGMDLFETAGAVPVRSDE